MTNDIKEYDGLRIQVLSYDRPTQESERFYFLEMSTLQATTQIPNSRAIMEIKVVAYNDQNKFLDIQTLESFKAIEDFNSFFQGNSGYYIHDCDIELEGELVLSSHDDGEVSIQIKKDGQDRSIISAIFNRYGIDENIIQEIKNEPGHYIEIDRYNKIIADYETFDDYIEKIK